MRRTTARLAVLTLVSIACTALTTTALRANDTPDPALRDYLGANGLLNRGLYELAAVEYRKFLEQHEDHDKAALARYGLGVSLFRMKLYDAAAKELTSLHKRSRFEFAAEVGTILGQCHLAAQRHDEAAKAFGKVLRRLDDEGGDHDLSDDAAAGLTEALYLGGRYDHAFDACQQFVTRWADSPLRERTEFFGGMALMARRDYAEGAEWFAGLLKRYPDGPFAGQASFLLAQCYQNDNAIDKAIRQYRKLLERGTGPGKSEPTYMPDALFGLSVLLQQQGKASEAGTFLDQLLTKPIMVGDAHSTTEASLMESARLQRGRAWFDEGEFDHAFEMFGRVYDEGGKLSDQAAYWMGKCKLREGEFDDAAGRLAEAIERFPESDLTAEMFYDRAIALVRAGRDGDAAKALRAFRARFARHALSAEALQLLAATEHQLRRFEKSEACCTEFLKEYPAHDLAASVAFLSAENGFLSEQYDESVERYRRFLSTYSDDPQADKGKFRLGMALYIMERFDEAEPFLIEITDGTETSEVFSPALLAMGDIHFQRGEWTKAERWLGDYLSPGPGVPSADDALLKLGLARQRQGRGKDALEAYDELITRFEDSPHRLQAVFERGQALAGLERFDEAVEAFKAVLNEDGDSRFVPFALNHLAVIATQRNDFQEASRLFARTAQTASETELEAEALFQSARTLMTAKQFKAAQEGFDRFLDQHASHAQAGEARAQRAIALARQDRYADAVEAVISIEKDSFEKLDPSLRATLTYEKAWCLRELGRFDEAAEAYRRLLKEEHDADLNVHAVVELAGIELNAKRFDEAANLLQRVYKTIEAEPDQVPPELREQAVYRLAVCEFELGRYKEVAKLLETFVEAFPQSSLRASASFYCGEAAFKLSRHELAVKHLSRVAEEFKDAPVYGPSLLRLGEALAALQRWARSERVFTAHLGRFGDGEQWYQAQFGMAWACENQKRYDEAISAYRQVVTRHQGPTAARAQFQIGECLFAKKQYGEAAGALLKVDILYAYPEWSAAALYEAARCFEKLGKAVEAHAHYKQVVNQHKETRWARLASQRLSETSGTGLPGR